MRIKISKQTWLQIAKKAGWFRKIKIAQTGTEEMIEIEGKYYVERNGNIEEVESPNTPMTPSQPKSVTVSTRWGNIIFTEGKIEENYYGKYHIVSINEAHKTITVEYIDVKNTGVLMGEQKTYPIQSQAEAIIKEKMRREREMRYSTINFGSKEFFTVGFLAKYGRIRVEVPRTLKNKFDEMYKRFTGQNPEDFLEHGYAADLNPETKGNSWEFRITFPNPGPELLNRMNFSNCPPIASSANKLEVNYSNYIMNLFRLGFTMGNNANNLQTILSAINGDEERNSFIEGTNAIEH